MRFCFVLLFLFTSFLSSSYSSADEFDLETNCRLLYERSGFCPPDTCDLRCRKGMFAGESCIFTCVARPCEQTPVQYCSKEFCRVILGCTGELVCYPKETIQSETCGKLAYSGDELECCDNMVKRCGVEFFDGTCDMEGANSIYSVPICISCGNDICNQFENACNCPEDCKQEKKIPALLIPEQ